MIYPSLEGVVLVVVGLATVGLLSVGLTRGVKERARESKKETKWVPHDPTPQIRSHVAELRALSGTTDDLFEELYLPVIEASEKLLNPIRPHIPLTHVPAFESKELLNRIRRGLKHRQGIVCGERPGVETDRQSYGCWTYVLFCCVAIRHVLHALQSVDVVLENENRRPRWNALVGPIGLKEQIAEVRPVRTPQFLGGWQNVLIIPRLVPQKGLDWILRTNGAFPALASVVVGQFSNGHPLYKAIWHAEGPHAALTDKPVVPDELERNNSPEVPRRPATSPCEEGRTRPKEALPPQREKTVVETEICNEGSRSVMHDSRQSQQTVIDRVWGVEIQQQEKGARETV